MHALSAIGDTADEKTARAILVNLVYHDLLSQKAASLMLAATGDSALRLVDQHKRDAVRAAILKQMLLTLQA
jgi:transcriptional regulator CtsR